MTMPSDPYLFPPASPGPERPVVFWGTAPSCELYAVYSARAHFQHRVPELYAVYWEGAAEGDGAIAEEVTVEMP